MGSSGISSFAVTATIPNWWADALYSALPIAELGISLLFVFSNKRHAYLLSAAFMLVFTVYIGLGVMGLYAKRPCGCASVFSGLTWGWHLVVNIVLFNLSILGWYVSDPTTPIDKNKTGHKKFATLFFDFAAAVAVPIYYIVHVIRKRFPKRFAPFPGRPVRISLNYTFVALA